MRLGYIRVSRDTQTTALQEDAIQKAHCERIFTDKMSGVRDDRPEFLKMLDMARPGDVIVVWRLDRLGRSLRHLIETVTQMSKRGIELTASRRTLTPPLRRESSCSTLSGQWRNLNAILFVSAPPLGWKQLVREVEGAVGPRRQKPSSHAT